MKKAAHSDRLQLGACYYPEHWPQTLWADDYRRMKELGFSVIRVGEFAWSLFEPSEGQFSFELFDRALDLAHAHGLSVVFGTPTATPPAWLTHKYPEVLNVTREGLQYQHGQRRHYNYNANIYRELSARIVLQLAEHFKNHPAIIGWQIDNEINCEVNVFYSDADHAAFRRWLQLKYGSLDALNQAWGAVFWNQTYSDWGQVTLTRPTPSNSPNPHQLLDEKRFISDSAISFVKLQADIIRRIAPSHFVTTNGLFGHLDSHQMTDEALDFFAYDSYPNFSTIDPDQAPDALKDRRWGRNLSVARDISPNFWVMEQQSGPGGWVNRMEAPSPKPGQMRLWTYQSVAHGADAVLYFRWRTATFGTEIYWHGLNDYHNQPNRRVAEAGQIGGEFSVIGEAIAGSQFHADVAILKDYDNDWDAEFDKWVGPLSWKSEMAWYKALQYQHIPANITFLRPQTTVDDLLRYKLIVYPHPAIMSDDTAMLLTRYVEQGGQLILGCRTGYKDATGQCYMRPFPGAAADLCGITVEDFTLIGSYQAAPELRFEPGVPGETTTADGFNDILSVTSNSARVLARYAGDYYDGKPALVINERGNGSVYYYGAAFNQAVAQSLLRFAGIQSPAAGVVSLQRDIELCIRKQERSSDSYWFLLNYAHEPREIECHGIYRDVLTGRQLEGRVTVDPFGVLILEMQ